MKNLILLAFLLCAIQCLGFSSSSLKPEPPNNLISRFRPGFMWFYTGLKPHDTTKLRKYNRLMVDVFHTTYHNKFKSLPYDGRSIGFALNLMFDVPLMKRNTFGFGWGISFAHTNAFINREVIRDYPGNTTTITDSLIPSYERQKISCNYLEVPLDFRFRTKNWAHFKFHVGAKLGWQINSYTKFQPKSNQKHPIKTFNFPDRNLLRYGVYSRIGIRNWSLFGAYYFSPIFTNTKSTQLSSVELGLSFSIF